MSETIKTLSQLIAEFPDNILRLIHPVAARDLTVSAFGYLAGTDPGPNNDKLDTAGIGAFFDLGSSWLNYNTGAYFRCLDGSAGAAVWQNIAGSLPTIVAAGTNVAVAFDGIRTYTVSATGGGASAPLTLQPPIDADFALALKQHSATQSGPLLEVLDSTGTQFGPTITGNGQISNPGNPSAGINNELYGLGALGNLVAGSNNVAIGKNPGLNAVAAGHNVLIGYQPFANSNGSSNVVIGESALFGSAGGFQNQNVCIGQSAGGNTSGAISGVAIGYFAGYGALDGGTVVAIGFQSGMGASTGPNVTMIGAQAGMNNPGSGCTFLGANTDGGGASRTNSTAIGIGATLTGDHQIVMGTASETTTFPGPTSGIQYSDIAGTPAPGPASLTGSPTGTATTTPTTILNLSSPNGLIGSISFETTSGASIDVTYQFTDVYGTSNSDSTTVPPTGKFAEYLNGQAGLGLRGPIVNLQIQVNTGGGTGNWLLRYGFIGL